MDINEEGKWWEITGEEGERVKRMRGEEREGKGKGRGGTKCKGVTFIRRDFYGLWLTTVRSEARRRDCFVQTRIKCHYAI